MKKITIEKVLIALFLIIFVYSGSQIILWHIDNKKTDKQIKSIKDKVTIKQTDDSDKTEIIENNNEQSDPYWDYIKMNLIEVDFNQLKKINPSTKGWIKVEGTNINYPFVQTNNNDYYLTHSFDNSHNGGGWVFLDYRNNLNNEEKNTIIYAHGRENKTMFGTLKNILSDNWLNNNANHVVKMSTEYENTLWQVFSVYKIPTTNDYLQIKFQIGEFKSFTDTITNRSFHNFKTTVTDNDRILTLSTCFNDYEKVVLHAKLIKREKK
ncbi:MAG: class B sortase [Bacilli bacterium]|nr:class B sortase [Bacilli bacterium]